MCPSIFNPPSRRDHNLAPVHRDRRTGRSGLALAPALGGYGARAFGGEAPLLLDVDLDVAERAEVHANRARTASGNYSPVVAYALWLFFWFSVPSSTDTKSQRCLRRHSHYRPYLTMLVRQRVRSSLLN